MIQVAIVDDDPLVCTYLRQMLSATASGVQVTGHAHDLAEGANLIQRTTPDVVLLDRRLGHQDGLDLLRRDGQAAPAVLVLTGYPDDVSVLRALRHGAAGFLTKSTAPRDLIAAIRLVASGHRVLGNGLPGFADSPAGAAEHTEQAQAEQSERAWIRGLLTAREVEVLARLGSGMSNADISADLGVGEGTVKGHVSSLLVKLGYESRLQAGLLAQRTGL